MRIDFHVHTVYSIDSLLNIKDLIRKAKELNIVPTITDHNTIAAQRELSAVRGFDFILGEEVRTAEGFDLTALYISERIEKGTSVNEMVDRVREQGGLLYLPHPFDITRAGSGEREDVVELVDIIEVFNARCIFSDANKNALSLAERNRKLKGAGSDAHTLMEFGSTYVETEEFDLSDPKSLLRALQKGRIVGKTAPFYMRGVADAVSLLRKCKLLKPLPK